MITRVDAIQRRHDEVAILYASRRGKTGEALIEMMRTHLIVLVGGVLQRHLLFGPPQALLTATPERRDWLVPTRCFPVQRDRAD